jgi:hypothetical protein
VTSRVRECLATWQAGILNPSVLGVHSSQPLVVMAAMRSVRAHNTAAHILIRHRKGTRAANSRLGDQAVAASGVTVLLIAR